MNDSPIYKEALETARTEFDELVLEEGVLDSKLVANRARQEQLKKTLESLSTLVGEEADPRTVGITEAIRNVLRNLYSENKTYALSPLGVKQRLEKEGYKIEYKNPMAVIHTTLKRLEDQREVKSTPGRNNKTLYSWDGVTDDDIPF